MVLRGGAHHRAAEVHGVLLDPQTPTQRVQIADSEPGRLAPAQAAVSEHQDKRGNGTRMLVNSIRVRPFTDRGWALEPLYGND
ncbi:hypothetical protein NCCP1664_17800 [Zafaria cholistanensis]|uniref:Uncharacterized protein n=1 Tax=Zafaria cholistanensis TaxID=1682741 RepID=A0A5A7NQR9_9MICC|nr:hypothetical protein [Zafaria cholistanensis]GER23284.1 hypothetical protein NCCP1664_17800 [Zafaria cholistanensis]